MVYCNILAAFVYFARIFRLMPRNEEKKKKKKRGDLRVPPSFI